MLSLSRRSYILFTPCYWSSTSSQIHNLNPDKSLPYNLTPKIISLSDRKLFKINNHPLTILKHIIERTLGNKFKVFDDVSPVVTVQQNFQALNIAKNHVSRQCTDTFYINNQYVLRTHTSAHEKQYLSKGLNNFMVFGKLFKNIIGDVYRRDQIDKYHYPAFHQMEAVSVLGEKDKVTIQEASKELKSNIEKIIKALYGDNVPMRWIDAYFPFTEPSFELEIFFDGKWVQMLGSGILHPRVMERAGRSNEIAWAAGLGLERLAMRLFNIPDVRLFWSQDTRFLSQFSQGTMTPFKQFSKYPACFKDLSMYIKPHYNPNNLFSIIRDIAGDLIENVQEVETYDNKKLNKVSKTYRVCFRSLERTLTNDEITKMQFQIRDKIDKELKEVELR